MPAAPTKFSPVDAARLALASPPMDLSPRPRARVAVGAAVLWCRELAIPSVRRLAAAMGRAPVTVLNRFDHLIDVYAEVIRSEWLRLERGWHPHPSSSDAVDWLAAHASALAAVDAALLRLPMLVRAAVVAADPALATPDPRAWVPLHVVAAFAEPGVVLPRTAELRQVLADAA